MVDEYTWREKALLTEQAEVEALLASALGYGWDEQYGWVTGDHTVVTLAMEVQRRGVLPRAPRVRRILGWFGLARRVKTWMCPHCRDIYGPKDEDRPPVCDMCRKAGRT